MLYLLWIYFLFLSSVKLSSSDIDINQAPAKVTLWLQLSRLSQTKMNESPLLKLCVDKQHERCFWKFIEEMSWDGEQYKDKSFTFFIDNMANNLTLDVMIENIAKKIVFPRKIINLTNFNSKISFSIYSLDLDSFITVTIEHECENGYYPPRQCTKVCYPVPGESECDGFGNKLCKEGLLYNSQVNRCISNNCNIPCVNGRCVKSEPGFKCICLEGFLGRVCQFRSPCNPNPCFNGGKCIHNESSQSFLCSCPAQFSGSHCLTNVPEKCPCPENMKCNYSDKGLLVSCTSKVSSDGKQDTYISTSETQDITQLKSGGLGSKKYNEWNQVNFTIILIITGACLILLLCTGGFLFIYCRGRENRNIKRDDRTDNSPSTLYTEFTPKLNETSFERSFSLDDNLAYMSGNSQILQILPNNFTMGSSTAYSLNSNSYQDNQHSSLIHFPIQGTFICQQDYPITPIFLQQTYTKNNDSSMSTMSSSTIPPMLPPRNTNTEEISPNTLPTSE